MPVPGPEELDAPWVERALREAGDAAAGEIVALRSRRIGVGYGLEGTLARLTLVSRDGRESTMVAKWCGARDGTTENRFYREIGPHLDGVVPRLRAFAVEEDRALLLLEDVAPARQGDAIVGATPEEAGRLVEAAAGLHAAFWGSVQDAAVAWLPRWGGDPAGWAERTSALLPRFRDRWAGVLPREILAAADRLPEDLVAAHASLARAPRTVIHGDLHFDNVLVRPDGSPVVIDWAQAALGPGVVDVVRFLVEGVTAQTRRAHERSLLDRYLGALTRRGIDYEMNRLLEDASDALTVLFAGAIRFKDPCVDSPVRLGSIVENLVRNVTQAVADWRLGPRRT
jgi:hypothetical protein